MLASANESQKAKYEAQLQELEVKLKEAEEKNQWHFPWLSRQSAEQYM